MTPPPTSIDGTDITGATIDGTDVTEITVDGDTVFAALDIPDAGLKHHYTSREVNASDGDAISTLTDQEGSEDLSQTNSSLQATYKTDQINGNPVLRFESDYLDTSFGTILTQPFEIFTVARYNTVGGDNDRAYDAKGNLVRLLANDGVGENSWTIFAGSSLRSGSSADLDTTEHLWTARYDGSNSQLRLDESDVASGSAGSNDLDGFTLGNRSGGLDETDIDIGEVLIYDPTVSGYSRSDVESVLVDIWGPF